MKWLCLPLILVASPLVAHEYQLAGLEIIHPVIVAPPPNAGSAAAYMTIANDGTTDDRLLSVTVDGIGMVMIHTTKTDAAGMTSMEMLPALDLPAGAIVALEPGAMHLMLTGLTAPLVKDTTIGGQLTFEKAGSIDIDFMIEGPGGSGPDAHAHH